MGMLMGPNIFLILVLAAGIILLQLFLSGRDSKWFGLLLPAISFGVSLLLVFSLVAYTNIGITSSTISENGIIVSQQIEDTRADFGPVVGQVVITFLLANLPTVVLFSLYGACRGKRKRGLEMGKMQIQDLE